jgi:hypothetical protein
MTRQTLSPPGAGQTEVLLLDLIGECHAIIREFVLPAAQAENGGVQRRRYLACAVELVRIAAAVGDAIARLRDAGERIKHLSPPRGEGG